MKIQSLSEEKDKAQQVQAQNNWINSEDRLFYKIQASSQIGKNCLETQQAPPTSNPGVQYWIEPTVTVCLWLDEISANNLAVPN